MNSRHNGNQKGNSRTHIQIATFETRLIRIYEKHPDENPTIFRPELHREGFFGVFAHPVLLELAGVILGPEIRLYPNYSVRPKLPENRRTEVLWHQDAGYTSKDADVLRMMNVWAPLVPVNVKNGCMEFIPGSHKGGVVPHEKDEYYLRIHDDYIKPVEAEAVTIEMLRAMSSSLATCSFTVGCRTAMHISDGASIFATKMPNNRRSGQHKDIYSAHKAHQKRS